jgi:mannan endo-1,6-alpha-mannosidase
MILRSSILVPTLITPALSLKLDITSSSSIKQASSTIVKNLLTFYPNNQKGFIPGLLPKPYFWWQSGALWGELVEYWAYTGDSTWNSLVTDAITFQIGPGKSFMPENVTHEEGNDDQAFWAFTALTAAELKFPDPPKEKSPSWLALAQAVFNNQVTRWDTTTCGGGLRWQIFIINAGYDYKNTISNGAFFQLAARLARYTGNLGSGLLPTAD